jgi:hypothetical protein
MVLMTETHERLGVEGLLGSGGGGKRIRGVETEGA